MSGGSAKRRAKRKIAQMVRMDQTRQRMRRTPVFLAMMGAPDKQHAFVNQCMVPLGRKLARMGLAERAFAAMQAAGTDIVEG